MQSREKQTIPLPAGVHASEKRAHYMGFELWPREPVHLLAKAHVPSLLPIPPPSFLVFLSKLFKSDFILIHS